MYCRKCGKQLADGMAFCPACGTRIESTENNEEITVVEEKKSFFDDENNNLKIMNIILLTISIVDLVLSVVFYGTIIRIVTLSLSLIIAILALIFYIKKKSKYDFLSFSITITLFLYNIGMLVYVYSLK